MAITNTMTRYLLILCLCVSVSAWGFDDSSVAKLKRALLNNWYTTPDSCGLEPGVYWDTALANCLDAKNEPSSYPKRTLPLFRLKTIFSPDYAVFESTDTPYVYVCKTYSDFWPVGVPRITVCSLWVKVVSLAADDTFRVFTYYKNDSQGDWFLDPGYWIATWSNPAYPILDKNLWLLNQIYHEQQPPMCPASDLYWYLVPNMKMAELDLLRGLGYETDSVGLIDFYLCRGVVIFTQDRGPLRDGAKIAYIFDLPEQDTLNIPAIVITKDSL